MSIEGQRQPRRPRGTPSNRAVWVILTVLATFSLAVTVARAQETEPSDRGENLVAEGLDLFGTHCAICHGAEGGGIPGVAPGIRDASPALIDFVIRTGRMPLPRENARVVRRQPALSPEQREAIVAYFEALNPEALEVPEVSPEGASLAEGREIYESNCIACHSAFGSGVAVSEDDIAPGLHAADPVEIAEAVRVGPGVMPLFTDEQITDEEMDALVRYILYLRDPPQPGGLTIGLSGPVTEGFVAWGLGTIALVAAIYFIGERGRD